MSFLFVCVCSGVDVYFLSGDQKMLRKLLESILCVDGIEDCC